MHFFKQFLVAIIFVVTSSFIVGCGGGEADYSLEQVRNANVADLIQGDITFITPETLYVDQSKAVITTIQADTSKNITYSIVGGNDKDLFTIDNRTGDLAFIATPTYNSVGSNEYEVIVGVTTASGELSTLHILVSVAENINTIKPIVDFAVNSIDAVSGTAVITQIQARPAKENDYLSFNIIGQDAGNFNIDNNGNLVFKSPLPDFGSTPNKIYTIAVEIMDGNGNLTTTEPIQIRLVGDRNLRRPVIESSTFNVVENALGNMQIQVKTLGTGVVTKYILSGADASVFVLDNTGILRFKAAKDFELGHNSYSVSVQVEDDKGNFSDLKSIQINVVDVDEGYTFESIANVTVLSGTQAVTQVNATSNVLQDVTRKYTLNNFQDIFTIDDNGTISFITPAQEGQSYDLSIVVKSYASGTQDLINGSKTVSSVFNVSVVQNPSLIAPTISSGYLTSTSVTAPIDTTKVITTIDASFGAGSDATSLSYKTVGEDAVDFEVDSNGNLRFKNVRNFIVGGDNTYRVAVEIKDDNGNVTMTDVITIELLQDPREIAPIISITTFTTPENGLGDIAIATTTLGSGSVESYAIVGGADSSLFNLNSNTGHLSFKAVPDFESISHSNIYKVNVTATDSNANVSDITELTITVSDVDEKVTFTSLLQFNTVENSPLNATVAASSSVANSNITYSIVSTEFTIDSVSGQLHFIGNTTPTYDTQDNSNNIFNIQVTAQSQFNGSEALSPVITITILPQDRSIHWNVTPQDNTATFHPDGSLYLNQKSSTDISVLATSSVDPVMTYSIECNPSSVCLNSDGSPIFSIDPNSGLMNIKSPAYIYSADPEDNTYRATVFVEADDGFSTTDSIAGVMHVNQENGVPLFESPSTFSVDENSKTVGTVHAALPAVVGSSLKYSIVGGADSSLFRIDELTGELLLNNAEDFENPTNSNNRYEVIVQATDVNPQNNLNVASQTIIVIVNDVVLTFDNNTIYETASDGYRTWSWIKWKYYITTTNLQVTAATTATSGTWAYSIISNPDSNIFSINSSGMLRVDAPRYSGDQDFYLQIQAIDENGLTRVDWLKVTILDD